MPKSQTKRPAPRRSARNASYEIVTDRGRRLHVPHRSRHVPADVWVDFKRAVPEAWRVMARDKGFRIDRRVRDRTHVALECELCGALTAHKIYTLRTAQPRCGGCAEAEHLTQARKAGLTFLHRDRVNRHYALYRAKCGHVVKRQFEFLHRIAAGNTDVRCEICLQQREAEEARRQGWLWIGRDPGGNPNYRLYRHHCGQTQRIARGNMQWGQCDCARCGKSWAAKPSFIYLLGIEFVDRTPRLIKLGYSKHPIKRWRHQLKLPKSAKVDVMRIVAMPTGHDACGTELAAHATLLQQHPELAVPHEVYADVLNVTSEVYWPIAEEVIHTLLDGIEARFPAKIS
ncbi:MAG: hypothetical protein Q8K20_04885 [Gemmobacter sp.]|nr:hypothetical protein [Gemmobacter sp.]